MPGQINKAIALRANRRKGLVDRDDLLAAGLTRGQINWRVQSGLLIPEYEGIYRVGHCAPSLETSYLAAVLACGKGALLSGRAAAHLYGLIKGPPRRPRGRRPRRGDPRAAF